jgi:hypothetical protein
VLQGSKIFDIFFEGTTFSTFSADGTMVDCDLKTDWDEIKAAFENALADVSDLNENKRLQLEVWYEIIAKVMRLWEAGVVEKNQQDADDFYVFLQDEEERGKLKQ